MKNEGYCYRHVFESNGSSGSLADYLSKRFGHSNAEEWQLRIEQGEILLDGIRATGHEDLRPGLVVEWNRPGWEEEATPQNFEVLFVDESFLVVSKPSGLPTLPGAGFFRNTLLSLVQKEYPLARPMHRLGRATSGVVLFALNASVAGHIHREWSAIQKQYRALGTGAATELEYDIQTRIGPCAHPRLGTVAGANPAGKRARSIARRLKSDSNSTLFEIDLLTGRPHQIRIHLGSIGHPLVGDPLYGPGGVPLSMHPGLPGDGGYLLHAHRLALHHPKTGQWMRFEAELPSGLQ